MASASERARAAQALRGAGFAVEMIAELLGAAKPSVYGWLKQPVDVPVSLAADLEGRLAGRDDLDETFVVLARALAGKLDRLIASDKGVDAATIPPLTKEYRGLVEQILGPSSDDKEWLLGVFAAVGHSPNGES